MTTAKGKYVGVDVGKFELHVANSSDRQVKIWANDSDTLPFLVKELVAYNPKLVVLEASGGYERRLVRALASVGLPCAVVNPTQVKAYRLAAGIPAKTDRLDTRLLLSFGEKMEPEPHKTLSDQQIELKAQVARRQQLLSMVVQEKNRLQISPLIRTFYERLRLAGKPYKVAMVACMRKLLTILNLMVRENMPWKAPA